MIEVAVRIAAGVAGTVIVAAAYLSAIRTVVLPRGVPVLLTRWVFVANRAFFLRFIARRSVPEPERDDRLALYAPVSLLLLPWAWTTTIGVGFALLFVAAGADSARRAVELSGSSLLTLGFARTGDLPTVLLSFAEALMGLGIVALLISFLPTIYAHFSRREAAVALLETRAGTPPTPWGWLQRSQAIGWLTDLDDVFAQWESWFIEIEESHTSFGALVFFRSPQPHRSWITAAGCVLDTASLAVAATPHLPSPQTQLCIRSGFLALRRIADLYGIAYDPDPLPTDPISITRAEFDEAYDRMAGAGISVRPDRDAAWRDFAGWRVNYDVVLRALCGLVEAPPVPWSSDRAIPYRRPPMLPSSIRSRRVG